MSKPDLVIFLGAGFSRPAGLPVMAEFWPRSRSTQPGLVRHAAAPPSSPLHRVAAKPLHQAGLLYEAFRDRCVASGALAPSDWDNVERVFGIAEALHQAGIEHVDLRNARVDVGILIENIKLWIWKTYQQLPIKRGAAARDPDHLPVDAAAYGLLFGHLQDYGLLERTTFVTTNYDIVTEYAAFLNGTPCRYPHDWQRYKVSRGSSSFVHTGNTASGPLLCKLHGSINFFEGEGEDTLRASVELGDGSDIGDTGGGAFRDEPAIAAMGAIQVVLEATTPRLSPAIVPPSFSKLHRSSWLRSTWQAALQALSSAQDIIFIGYSLPPSDGYMEALLLAAQMFRDPGRSQTVTVVDPRPAATYARLYPNVCLVAEGFSDAVRGRLREVLEEAGNR